jgi:hypothetical protein
LFARIRCTYSFVTNHSIVDIYECIQAAEVTEAVDPNCLMTMVIKPTNSNDSRIMAMELPNKEDRNVMLTGIRSLVSQKSMQSHATAHLPTPVGPARSSSGSLGNSVVSGNVSLSSTGIRASVTASSASGSISGAVRKPYRRQSVRDIALEEALHAGDMHHAQSHAGVSAGGSTTNAASPNIVSGQNPMAARRKVPTKPPAHAISELTSAQVILVLLPPGGHL